MAITSPTLNVMIAAVRKAAKAITRDFNEVDKLQVSRKGTADFATNADRKSEKILFDELSKARPGYGFLMEESGEVKGTDPTMQWVIDPIDGTHNFIHAVPFFCLSVGLEKIYPDGKREGQAAVIFDLVHDELYIAERGQGAFMNDRRLLVSARRDLESSLIAAVAPRITHKFYPQGMARFERFTKQACSLRCSGSTALDLAYLAAGRVDAAWFTETKRWDVAAGLLLILEAGGTVEETPASPGEPALLLVSNGHLHEKLKGALG